MRSFLNAIEGFLMLRSAPFETPPAAAPQDKLARLEARTTAMQSDIGRLGQLDYTLRRGRLSPSRSRSLSTGRGTRRPVDDRPSVSPERAERGEFRGAVSTVGVVGEGWCRRMRYNRCVAAEEAS
jgi:hypothetical protein